MALPKVIGTETEYGITVVNQPDFNPVLSSSAVINSYAGGRARIQWSFDEESPGRDARGFGYEEAPVPDVESGLVNVVLTNGARFYVDHAHPEYSTPECTDPLQGALYDKAGELIMWRAVQAAQRLLREGERLVVHKNNSDGKGNSYGTHENYLVDRQVPFGNLVAGLTPFFISRQIFCGAGKLGGEASWDERSRNRFQITQRADFFEAEVGLETTLKRPIINTRDEPHADPEKYRRLHVIVGDANMCEVATLLKLGTTSLVLKMIEDDDVPDLTVASPVPSLHDVSRDTTCSTPVRLADGRRLTPVQMQWEYLERARKYVEQEDTTADNLEVLDHWEAVLTGLEDDPMQLSRELDWVAKYRLLESYRERDGLDWSDAKLRLIDLQYHDVRRDKGLYHRLAAGGRVERLVSDEEIERAVMEPPEDTRAYFRGRCIARYPDAIAAASWDSIIFDTGADALQRVPMREPLKGTKEHVDVLFRGAEDAGALVELLRS